MKFDQIARDAVATIRRSDGTKLSKRDQAAVWDMLQAAQSLISAAETFVKARVKAEAALLVPRKRARR